MEGGEGGEGGGGEGGGWRSMGAKDSRRAPGLGGVAIAIGHFGRGVRRRL